MSLDTKYRPTQYEHVLGQQSIVTVLKKLVSSGAGFHQSYLFAGSYGGGKTTLGRILARALLCTSSVDGQPCDTCVSCSSFLNYGSSTGFTELDAATNSGIDDIRKMLAELDYSAFSGGRRVYLLDEAHRLSKDALDSLLKPLEDNLIGTLDKRMICIFCTTEPEKMRATILSRCAPAFVLQPVAVSDMVSRLQDICQRESIYYEYDMLQLLSEETLPHIRDSLKALEAVSVLGGVTRENVFSYLHLGTRAKVLSMLEAFAQQDETYLLQLLEDLLDKITPQSCYDMIVSSSLLLYRISKGVASIPSYWQQTQVSLVCQRLGRFLLTISQRLSKSPARPSRSMLVCDVLDLFSMLQSGDTVPTIVQRPQYLINNSPVESSISASIPVNTHNSKKSQPPTGIVKVEVQGALPYVTSDGTYIDPRAVNQKQKSSDEKTETPPSSPAVDITSLSSLIMQELGGLKG